FIEADRFWIFLLFAAIVMGQARTFLRDWTPFVVIFFGWQMLRGYADQAARGGGFPLHEADLVRWEQALFGGHLPTLVLQQWLYTPGEVRWWDVMATAFWAFHFVLALLFAFLLWLRSKQLYWRFVYALMVLSFAGFATYVLFPAVPPWLAHIHGTIPQVVHHIQWEIWGKMGFGMNASWVMEHGNPNDIAAMPSLHAAYPTLVFLFCLRYWKPAAPAAFLYCCGLWFSIVYIGDHYVIDALVGIAYALITFAAMEALYRWLERRRQASPQAVVGEEEVVAGGSVRGSDSGT
ncbi:MAG: phosphatase PAP2 family protein, partial [Chloroflexota bacterium]|nr:phosphatase PAP2 family protein [Chloroflexota bacterium]